MPHQDHLARCESAAAPSLHRGDSEEFDDFIDDGIDPSNLLRPASYAGRHHDGSAKKQIDFALWRTQCTTTHYS
jgi:hypothetical protein